MKENEQVLDALRACIEAFAVATPGPWEWSENLNILGDMPDGYDETREVAAVYTERDDDLAPKNAVAILAAENLIRQHGPALEQSLRSLADENRALLRERDALRKSVEGLLEHAVIFSRSYLAVFNDWPDDKTLQGCETGRWRKAADAADFARATLAGPKP